MVRTLKTALTTTLNRTLTAPANAFVGSLCWSLCALCWAGWHLVGTALPAASRWGRDTALPAAGVAVLAVVLLTVALLGWLSERAAKPGETVQVVSRWCRSVAVNSGLIVTSAAGPICGYLRAEFVG